MHVTVDTSKVVDYLFNATETERMVMELRRAKDQLYNMRKRYVVRRSQYAVRMTILAT
jgi:hypothetical protein